MQKYYLDTSIWLDLFENRDEPNFPKGKIAHELLRKIIKDNNQIIFTDLIKDEIKTLGYNEFEIENLFKPFQKILITVEPSRTEFGKAKDLAFKRDIPLVDALHAILARNNKAVLVTRDHHFQKLLDITKSLKPEELI